MVDNWSSFVQQLLYPDCCVLCGARGEAGLDICAGCRTDLPVAQSCCAVCAAVLPRPGVCGSCLSRPPPYQRSFALFRYHAPVDRLLLDLKFHGKLARARLLGALLAQSLAARSGPWPELIVPVPLHGSRLRERGYNQSLELARPVARMLGLPIDWHCCQRIRPTPAQSTLPAGARRRNVRGAFRVIRPLEARRIALLDDVVTTGNTVAELARVLRAAGATDIEVWCCARA